MSSQTIFRAVNNWVHVCGKDGRTPAMRLGLARNIHSSKAPFA